MVNIHVVPVLMKVTIPLVHMLESDTGLIIHLAKSELLQE